MNRSLRVSTSLYLKIGEYLKLIPRFPPLRLAVVLASLTLVALGIAAPALAQERHVLVAEVDGMINPVTQRFIARAIEKAEKDGAELIVIELDTPGGLLSSTRKIVEDLLAAEVPTAVYVFPPGARAASAGTFITAAANFAVMAPATNIGAASPVGLGEDLDETLKAKVIEDTAALMRSISNRRGRNSEALEDTVLSATAYDAQQAVGLNVVDFIAEDLSDLLGQVDGTTVDTATGLKTLDTDGLAVREIKMTVIERFLFFLADPNISFLLLSLGGLGLVLELFNPGSLVPGIAGVICLFLAFVSLGNLPVNWAGAGLILLAAALLTGEIFVAGFGVLGVGAIVSFILGGLLLFSNFGTPSPTEASVKVNPYLLGSIAGALTLSGVWFFRTVVASRRETKMLGPEPSPLIGSVGVVTSDMDPTGTVMVETEVWTAVSEGDSFIKTGEKVRVTEVEGAILTVVPVGRSDTE